MRIFVQIVDTKSGISQHGMIEEPIQKGLEIANALGHFGVNINSVEWNYDVNHLGHSFRTMMGNVSDTTKVVSVIAI